MLIKQHGDSIAKLNEAIGLDRTDATLSQIRTKAPHSKTGTPRSMGDPLARKIEEKLGLERGWMDTPISTPSASVLHVSDKVFEWYWPFKDITPKDYREALEQDDRDAIEATANAIFKARNSAAKQNSPEKNIAAEGIKTA